MTFRRVSLAQTEPARSESKPGTVSARFRTCRDLSTWSGFFLPARVWSLALAAFGDSQFGEFRRDCPSVCGGKNLLIDVEDFPVCANVKRPARNGWRGHAVRFRNLPCRIA